MIKKIFIMMLMLSIIMLTPSLAATGHINGCTNTGDPADCCAKSFNIIPEPGYKIVDLIVNGVSHPVPEEDSLGMIYSFTDITEGQTLEVVTEAIPTQINFDISYSSGVEECYPSTFEIMPGETKTFFVVTKPGYRMHTSNGVVVSMFDEESMHYVECIGEFQPNVYEYRITGGTTKSFHIGVGAEPVVNAPVIREGEMVPVVWDSSKGKWKTASVTYWGYNYNSVAEESQTTVGGNGNGRWANAMTYDGLTYYESGTSGTAITPEVGDIIPEGKYIKTQGSQYVWIPRYTYRIESGYHNRVEAWNSSTIDGTEETVGKISIRFSDGIEDDCSDGYILHPAFRFGGYIDGLPMLDSNYDGEVTDLTGFWVAKYDNSLGNNSVTDTPIQVPTQSVYAAQFKPNVNFSRLDFVGGFMCAYNTYRNADSHLIKNIEWGAIVYLTNAIGKSPYGNDDNITGKAGENQKAIIGDTMYEYDTIQGVKGSTTHNIYGVYDMNGCAADAVAGFVDNPFSLSDNVQTKYYDLYPYDEDYPESKIGDAMQELHDFRSGVSTSYGWDGANNNPITSESLSRIYVRGESTSFYSFSHSINTSYNGFRVTLSIPQT